MADEIADDLHDPYSVNLQDKRLIRHLDLQLMFSHFDLVLRAIDGRFQSGSEVGALPTSLDPRSINPCDIPADPPPAVADAKPNLYALTNKRRPISPDTLFQAQISLGRHVTRLRRASALDRKTRDVSRPVSMRRERPNALEAIDRIIVCGIETQ